MEANRKLRGFIKGKLMSFNRAAKPSSTVQYTGKVKPSQSSPSTASVGFLVPQDYVVSQPKQKVSSIVPADNSCDLISQLYDDLYGVAADESVDMKAASYISSVQGRFNQALTNEPGTKEVP